MRFSERAGRRKRNGRFRILWECGDPQCGEFVSVNSEEYAAVRENRRRFPVQPGHEISDIERVVEQRDRFTGVQKLSDVAHVVEDERG
jgi:hypothetical protein